MPAPAGPIRWTVRALLLSACLLLLAGGPPSSSAEEGTAEAAPEESLAEKGAEAAGRALDVTHASLQRNILERVIWFDDFFGNVKTEDLRYPEYVLRWVNSVRLEEGGGVLFRTAVRANLRLPKISERLRLVISGESEADPAARLPEDPGSPGFDRTLPDTRVVNAEVRLMVLERPTTLLFLGTGLRLVLPPEVFARTRFQYTRRLGAVSLVRFGETLFWKDQEGFGETTEVDLERQVGRKTVLRWANVGTVSQETAGVAWGTELSLQRQLSPKSAVTLLGGINGETDRSPQVETYRTLVRFRRNVLRRWLFVELEPELFWPRRDGGGYPPTFAFTFRIETVFQGSAAATGTPSPGNR